MKRLFFLTIVLFSSMAFSCGGDDDPGTTEDNLAGEWLLVSSDGNTTTVTNFGGSESTTISDFTITSSDFRLTFGLNPNKVTRQVGEFTIETTQSTDMAEANTTTQVFTEFADEESTWEIVGDILTLNYSNGDQESYQILELSNSTLQLKQETSSSIDIAGSTVESEGESLTVFERQ